jgi:tetratricopeptide (TPR) repeat protein
VICNRIWVRLGVTAVLVAVSTLRINAQQQLPRITLTDGRLKVVRVVQAEPVAGVYANTVTADVVIAMDGSVESVTMLEGQKVQHASAVAALKQYRFAPVTIDGKPARVILRIGVHVPDTISSEALAKKPGTTNSVTIPARRDVTLMADCSRAVSQLAAPGAIELCGDAVKATDGSSVTTAYERRAVRGWLADAYMLAKQWPEAITAYQSALGIDTKSDADDVNAGDLLIKMAVAYTNIGNLEAADRNAASAVAKVEASLAAHPDQRKLHVDALRTIYSLSAQVKRLRGDAEAATTLERKAAALGSSK